MLQNCEVKRAWVEIRTFGSTEQVKLIIYPDLETRMVARGLC
ncbi:UNVERIFIED_ORG: hypothetical protein GGE63_000643 [Rhizobium esperanzae]